jgi:hypothetical protein
MGRVAPKRTVAAKAKMLEALEKSLGIVTVACKMTGIARKTFYEWKKLDEDFLASVNEIQDVTLDFVENQLLSNIKNGNSAEVIFYLKTKGKNRGYIERMENINVEKTSLSDLSDDELKAKIEKTKKDVK